MLPSIFSKLQAVLRRIRRLGGFSVVFRHVRGIAQREGWRGVILRVRRNLSISLAGNAAPLLPGGRAWRLADVATSRFDGRIAVMLHAYYLDLLPEIRTALERMPQDYVLLVSVTDEAAAAEVRRACAGLPHLQRLDIKVLPNRGRDIAPLLAGFATELQAADLVCHIHTKKSLYTSTEQTGWRQHLYSHLFPESTQLARLFGLFTREPSLGIVYPVPWDAMPYWAYTWLSNRQAGRALLERLGSVHASARFDAGAYLDYPAGSMFWARRTALQPLFDLNLSYEDFPEEAGQNDGCLQHAVERCLVFAARLAGFSSAVIDTTDGFVRERDGKNLHHYLHTPLAVRLQDMARQADVVTLDIFDTLVQRPFADPDRVFDYLTDKLAAEGLIDDFTGRRKGAEIRARQRLGRDVSLPEIYAEMARSGVSTETCTRLEAMEVATEKRLQAPRPAMLSALTSLPPDQPRILVSDMYLTEPVLRKILADAGVTDYTALWVSNALGRRKDTGELWRHLRDEARLTRGKRILHIGDNEHSDIQLPLDMHAAQVCHVMRAASLFALSIEGTTLARRLDRMRWQDDLLFGLLARRAGRIMDVRPAAFADRSYFSAAEDFGYALFGPLLFHYLGWIIEQARADGISHLLYVAREGHLLCRLHDKLAAQSGSTPLPRAHYFLCSRQSTGLPSLHRLDDLRELARSRFHGTLAEFVTVRLDPQLMELPALSAVADRKLLLPNDTDRLIELFEPIAQPLLARAAEVRNHYRHYVDGLVDVTCKSPDDLRRTALVDVGYSATTQRNLQRMLGCGLQGYYMMTHQDARLAVEDGGRIASCLASDLDYAAGYPLFRHSLILEAMLTAPHGQVRKILPTLDFEYAPLSLNVAMLDGLAAIHRGAEAFFDDVLQAFGADWSMVRFEQTQIEAIFESFVTGELTAGEVLRQMHVEDEFGGNGRLNVADFYGIGDRLPSTTG